MKLSLRERDSWLPASVDEIERVLGLLLRDDGKPLSVQLLPVPFRPDSRWVTVRVGDLFTLWVRGIPWAELSRRLARFGGAQRGVSVEGFPGDGPPPDYEYALSIEKDRGICWGVRRYPGPLPPARPSLKHQVRAGVFVPIVRGSGLAFEVAQRLFLIVGRQQYWCRLSRNHESVILTVEECMSDAEVVPCRICIGNLELPREVAAALREGVELQCTIPGALDVILQVEGTDYALGRLTLGSSTAESSLEIRKLLPIAVDY